MLLNDQTLPTIDNPISTEALQTLWSEIGTAGPGKHLLRVEIDRAADDASVFFSGVAKKRTYEWSRGLIEPDSAERIAVEPAKDGDGIQLVLTALDYTPIATVTIGA